jgi:ABC-type phosphate/phosphonate transport system substrate-binding protein
MDPMRRSLLAAIPTLAAIPSTTLAWNSLAEDYGPSDAELTLVIRDPLASELACACVEGYAQRQYKKIADYLSRQLQKSVRVKWTESLITLHEKEKVLPSIVIGKDSVTRFEGSHLRRLFQPVASLTDGDGSATQSGLFVVRAKNSAASLLDLEGYTLMVGPESCDEKHLAPLAKLAEADVSIQVGEICETCSVAAKNLLGVQDSEKKAAIISSYAERLLIGCGNIKKGDLRVIGQSDEVPFISAFVDSGLSKELKRGIRDALLGLNTDSKLLAALQSKKGFIPYSSQMI